MPNICTDVGLLSSVLHKAMRNTLWLTDNNLRHQGLLSFSAIKMPYFR